MRSTSAPWQDGIALRPVSGAVSHKAQRPTPNACSPKPKACSLRPGVDEHPVDAYCSASGMNSEIRSSLPTEREMCPWPDVSSASRM